jgi:hypothetical protein
MTRRVAAGLLIVSALSALAFLVLSAYAPDLRPETSSDANALSKSAVGFAGLRYLLENTDTPVTTWRYPQPCTTCSLTVLTPEAFTSAKELVGLARSGPTLIILPKWIAMRDPAHNDWVMKIAAFDKDLPGRLLNEMAKKTTSDQRTGTSTMRLVSQHGRFASDVPGKTFSIDRLQTIAGPNLVPEVTDEHGKTVLASVKGTRIYVLADPDFANNLGVHDAEISAFITGVISDIRADDRYVIFDLTLNGFRQSPDVLRAVFSPPFLGATLCAILAAAFLAFHAFSRFGPVARPDRVFAFGKRALADNTAAVIRLMRREPRMARRYAQATLRLVTERTGISRDRVAEPGWLAMLEKRNAAQLNFADLDAEAAQVRDNSALIEVAEKLYRWRRGILHEHR